MIIFFLLPTVLRFDTFLSKLLLASSKLHFRMKWRSKNLAAVGSFFTSSMLVFLVGRRRNFFPVPMEEQGLDWVFRTGLLEPLKSTWLLNICNLLETYFTLEFFIQRFTIVFSLAIVTMSFLGHFVSL